MIDLINFAGYSILSTDNRVVTMTVFIKNKFALKKKKWRSGYPYGLCGSVVSCQACYI